MVPIEVVIAPRAALFADRHDGPALGALRLLVRSGNAAFHLGGQTDKIVRAQFPCPGAVRASRKAWSVTVRGEGIPMSFQPLLKVGWKLVGLLRPRLRIRRERLASRLGQFRQEIFRKISRGGLFVGGQQFSEAGGGLVGRFGCLGI